MIGTLVDVPRSPRGFEIPEIPATAVATDAPDLAGRRRAVALMAAGLVVALAASGLVATQWRAPAVSEQPAAPAAGIVVTGPESVAVHVSGYDPRESSTWHRHSGLHAVAILSGTLTVYGPDCQAVRYGAGQSFVGGQELHIARNETDEPVQFTETILYPAGMPLETFVVPAGPPGGCEIR